ncbi:unnamed protein product, partial [marine sediment metagenome]
LLYVKIDILTWLKQGDSNQAHAEACTILTVGSCFIEVF